MATGDQADILARIKAVLPAPWFPQPNPSLNYVSLGIGDVVDGALLEAVVGALTPTPVLDGLLAGPAWGWSWLYGLLEYVAEQHRIGTATDSNLDLIGGDYFGTGLMRRLGEVDASYRRRILLNLLAPRGTRGAVVTVLTTLTGYAPAIFEPTRPADTGAWGNIADGILNTGLAYGTGGSNPVAGVGGWGDLLIPAQFFVTAYRPAGGGLANVAGWNTGAGGWGILGGPIEYGSMAMIQNEVTDADIFAAVNLSRPAGTIAWVAITGHPATPPASGMTSNVATLNTTFILDSSALS